MREDIHSKVKKQFGETAQNYVTNSFHRTGHDLDSILETAGDVNGLRVLDIATGGGHTAIAFSLRGARVTASDLTAEILDAARRNALNQGAKMEYVECSAEDLAFKDESFDIVSCRIAPHHFADPRQFMHEASRILVHGGRFFMIDNIAPQDRRLAEIMNTIEKRRDPSHVEAYTVRYWVERITEAGMEMFGFYRWNKKKNYSEWTKISNMDVSSRRDLANYILDLDEHALSYFEVAKEKDGLESLSHEAAFFYACKPL